VYFTIFTPLAVHIWKHLYLTGEKKLGPKDRYLTGGNEKIGEVL
jgi:hypothetical protein